MHPIRATFKNIQGRRNVRNPSQTRVPCTPHDPTCIPESPDCNICFVRAAFKSPQARRTRRIHSQNASCSQVHLSQNTPPQVPLSRVSIPPVIGCRSRVMATPPNQSTQGVEGPQDLNHPGTIERPSPTNNDVMRTTGNTVTINKTAFEKLRSEQLKKLTSIQSKQIAVLTEALKQYQEKDDIPNCCKIVQVKKIMADVATKLLYGSHPFSSMYPSEEVVKECILSAFDVDEDDSVMRTKFDKEWGPLGEGKQGSLQQFAMKNIRDRRGLMTSELRTEFYRLLGHPRPEDDVDGSKIEAWKEYMCATYGGSNWQSCVYEDGIVDPYGSKAVHGAIGRVLHGTHYDRTKPVYITLEHFGFFMHVMQLAALGRDMKSGHPSMHFRLMKQLEESVVAKMINMRRLIIVEKQ